MRNIAPFNFNDGTFGDPVPAVSVRFNTEDDALLGPITVYISPDNKQV